MRRTRLLGAAVAAVVIAADQAAKRWALAADADAPAPWLPFVDFKLQLNAGVSFSFFAQHSALGVWGLLAFTTAVILALGVWLGRAEALLTAGGLGAIIGGALGNALDRLIHGAVVDFFDLHAFGRHFFVFNIADVAINLGVAALILDAILDRKPASPA